MDIIMLPGTHEESRGLGSKEAYPHHVAGEEGQRGESVTAIPTVSY